jgi:hypothetical protein
VTPSSSRSLIVPSAAGRIRCSWTTVPSDWAAAGVALASASDSVMVKRIVSLRGSVS